MATLWRSGKLTSNQLSGNLFVLLLFTVGVHLFYGKTMQAGFVTDFTGLQERLDGAPFRGFLTCFGFPAMHQVANFFLYLFYKWFGTNGLPWYLVFTSLHVANGFFAFKLGEKIFSRIPPLEGGRGVSPKVPALMASILFLFNPYNAEPVIWKVCFNFLFCSFLMLASLWQLVRWQETSSRQRPLWSHIFFVGALFTFELAVVFPVMAVAWWWFSGKAPAFFKKITFPHFLLLSAYFFLNKLVLGGWVGHYGEEVHLKFDPAKIGSNLLKYFTKNLLYWRDWPHTYKEKLVMFCDKPEVGWAFLAIGFLLLAVGWFRLRKSQQQKAKSLWPMTLFFIALLPVSNLYVAWILHGENDRYGYFASIFFFMGLAGLLTYLPKILRYGLFVLLLSLSVFSLHRITGFWQNGSRIYYSLLEDFRWTEAKEVYVLAFPENYQGIPIFKDFSRKNLALKHALKYSVGKKTSAPFFQVAQFNMTSPEDGVSVQLDSTNHYPVNFNQWGNWWWRNGIGTGDYETEKYRFTPAGNGSKVELKAPGQGAVVIYSVGGKWREVIF